MKRELFVLNGGFHVSDAIPSEASDNTVANDRTNLDARDQPMFAKNKWKNVLEAFVCANRYGSDESK